MAAKPPSNTYAGNAIGSGTESLMGTSGEHE